MILALEEASLSLNAKAILRDVRLSFARGEVAAIVGPNGAGKSTLLQIASGLLRPSSGRALLDGVPLSALGDRGLAARRAMLPQESASGARFRVLELAAMGASVSAPLLSARQRAALAESVLDRLGLGAFAGRDMASLSGGERQRAHLARVLTQLEGASLEGPPGFLLMDEPLSAQDPAHQGLILRVAREHAARGGGAVIVLHDLNWASAAANRIVLLQDGMVRAQGPPADVLTGDLLPSAFGLAEGRVRRHEETGRPYILPHDTLPASRDQ